jgi:flagellin
MFNVSQANAIFGINNANKQMSILTHQLETGKKINSSKDDASGLSIANQLKSQHQGLSQAIKNSNDAISLTTIADGALQEYTDILLLARDKASQAVSDSNSVESRAALEADVKALMESADEIAKQTSFNGINLLDGTFTAKKFQTGAYSGQTTSISIANVDNATLGIDDASIDLTSSAGAATALTDIDAALKTLDGVRSGIGSVSQGLESRIRNMETTKVNIQSAESTIMDVDEAQARADLDQWSIRSQASMFAFQMAQQTQQSILSLFR